MLQELARLAREGKVSRRGFCGYQVEAEISGVSSSLSGLESVPGSLEAERALGQVLAACFSSQAATENTCGLSGCFAVVAAASREGSPGSAPLQA